MFNRLIILFSAFCMLYSQNDTTKHRKEDIVSSLGSIENINKG